MSKFSKSNATIDTTKQKPTRGNCKVHNEIKSWIKYLWKNGNVCPVDLISENAKEVLKFLCSRLGLALHVEEDVGLGLAHGLLVSQGYSTVVEVEPAALVRCIRCVVAGTNAVEQAQGQQSGTLLTEAPSSGAKGLPAGRYPQPCTADASLFEQWGSNSLKFYKNIVLSLLLLLSTDLSRAGKS